MPAQKKTKERMKKLIKDKLNVDEEAFCELYTSSSEVFGNGIQSYILAYDPDQSVKGWYDRAKSAAFKLLTKGSVIERINMLLEQGGLNDQNVDKQLMVLINQHGDFSNKIAAIREYNKLKQRIIDKAEVKIHAPITGIKLEIVDSDHVDPTNEHDSPAENFTPEGITETEPSADDTEGQ